ncbi:MAG: beta-lactamase family protein [Isosphaeraceae bacterium]|nr:beta-lactamase family protein [Isosphaeraceae bacterium]
MRHLRKLNITITLLGIVSAPLRADEVDDYVAARMKALRVPGLSLAVIRNGQVVKAKGYGLANVELSAPATEETVYEIGSVTKTFTATAVMMLVEEGKLGLDDPITQILPDLPAAWKDIKVRHLLTHTSGIKSYTAVGDFFKLARNDHTPDEILKLVSGRPLDFPAGEKWLYNNTGYYLLGLIVEKASGQRLAGFLAERIFKPLGMDKTRPNNPSEIIPHRASGYGEMLGVRFNREPLRPSAAGAAGFLISTVGDLAKWDAALREERLLRASSYQQMYTPVRLQGGETRPYGFGWGVEDYFGHRLLHHGGGTPGFSSTITRFPDDRVTVIVLANLAGLDAGRLALGIARLVAPELTLKAAKTTPDPDPKTTERLRSFLADLLAGKLVLDAVTPEMGQHFLTEPARKTLRTIAHDGELRAFELLGRAVEGKATTLRYRAIVGDAYYLVTLHLTAEGKIAGLTTAKDE